jgi:octaprenyl-diphosphate synthase
LGVVLSLEDRLEERAEGRLEQLSSLLADDMQAVNRMIVSRTGSDVTMIPEVANHLIASGGKRLRPMLTLAAAALCGYAGDGHVKLAASVEFMHTATLLHDDVVDESDMRRGKLAARMLWGNEASVLVGDFLLGQAFKMMVEVASLGALEVLANAAAVIAEGEVMQLSAAKNTATTEDDYLAVIRSKTAALFAAACEVGPILAGGDKAAQAACRSYGMNLGIAFQLVDDVLDYGGGSARMLATISARARSRCRWCCRFAAARRRSAASGAAPSRRAMSATATWRWRLPSCAATERSRTRWSGRATTAPWHAMRLPSSRRAR